MTLPSAIARQAEETNEYYNPETESKKEEVSTQESPKQQSSDDYEKRFKNYKASTDNTIHTQRLELEMLRTEAERAKILEQQVDSLRQEQPKFTKEALDAFSEEELNVFNEMVNSRTDALEQQVSSLTQQLDRVNNERVNESLQNEHITFKQRIVNAVGDDFNSIDTNPAFKDWLGSPDAYGEIRMNTLKSAQARQDVGRVVSFYTDFKQQNKPIDTRELQQVPESKASNATQPEATTRVWDKHALQEFYKDSGLGKYTEAQKQEIEAEIYASFRK